MVTMKTIYMETDAARLYLNDGRVLEHFWLEYQFLSSKEQTLNKNDWRAEPEATLRCYCKPRPVTTDILKVQCLPNFHCRYEPTLSRPMESVDLSNKSVYTIPASNIRSARKAISVWTLGVLYFFYQVLKKGVFWMEESCNHAVTNVAWSHRQR